MRIVLLREWRRQQIQPSSRSGGLQMYGLSVIRPCGVAALHKLLNSRGSTRAKRERLGADGGLQRPLHPPRRHDYPGKRPPWDRARPARRCVESCRPIKDRQAHNTYITLRIAGFLRTGCARSQDSLAQGGRFLKYLARSRNYLCDLNRAAEADCVETTKQGLAQPRLFASLRQRE